MASAYQYASLIGRDRVFRAIKLLPPERSILPGWPATIRLEIVEIDADAVVPYDALSYTWEVSGKQPPDRRVLIETSDGRRELSIFKPLETALLNFVANGMTDRPLFVDQICINQSDDIEKGTQVQLMRDIYAKSTRVVIWLGPGTRATDRYYDFVYEVSREGILGRVMGPNVAHFMTVFDAVMDPTVELAGVPREDRDDILEMLATHSSRFPLDGILDVLERVWFGRLWIIQEACLGSTVTFVCGSRYLCFDCFRAGILFFTIYNTYWTSTVRHTFSKAEGLRRSRILALSKSMIRIWQQRKGIHTLGRRQSLYDLVLKYNVNDDAVKIGASVPDDHIFALLGLAVDEPLDVPKVRYNETINVYVEFAAMALAKGVDMFLFSQFPKKLEHLPSWTPDWSMNLKVPYGYQTLTQSVFTAGSNGPSVQPEVDSTSGCVAVKGLIVDRVIGVGQREIHKDEEVIVTPVLDYRSVKLFCDEINDFLHLASSLADTRFATVRGEDAWTQIAIRLSDSGLTAKHFSDDPAQAEVNRKLGGFYEEVSKIGRRFLDTDARVESYRITRIIDTIGIIPWYWCPASEVDLLRHCATDPFQACKDWLKGAGCFFLDIVGICLASAIVVSYPKFLRIRRSFSGMNFRSPDREKVLEATGFNVSLSQDKEMNVYTDNLIKNIGRRLYLTESGYVGLGPRNMRDGDAVVVLFGSTVPHVLRQEALNTAETTGSRFSYVGEAYCDGIMDGELLQDVGHLATASRTFHIY